jgi:flagellar basal-body rod modification protein FlgD
MSTLALSAAASQTAAGQTQNVASSNTDKLVNQEAFLQLLVAQIKNQDPLNPTDGVQFLTQLAQFSQLEQIIGIRQDLEALTNKTSGTGQSNADSTVQA